MYGSVYDLKTFYNSKVGRIVRRILQARVRRFWPDVTGMRVMGTGYAAPYMRVFKAEAERVFCVMPAGQGVHHWPHNTEEKNLTVLSESYELPVESSSLDRILMVHDLEFAEQMHPNLQEIWRVLKPNGRVLVIVPNRSGLWSSADWSPFGLGTPYTETQICYYLRDNGFVHERSSRALFLPPSKRGGLMRFAPVFEQFGPYILPFFSGVHCVEASKQVFATFDRGAGARVSIRGRGLAGRPVPQSYSARRPK